MYCLADNPVLYNLHLHLLFLIGHPLLNREWDRSVFIFPDLLGPSPGKM
jgi:hypothetical protein